MILLINNIGANNDLVDQFRGALPDKNIIVKSYSKDVLHSLLPCPREVILAAGEITPAMVAALNAFKEQCMQTPLALIAHSPMPGLHTDAVFPLTLPPEELLARVEALCRASMSPRRGPAATLSAPPDGPSTAQSTRTLAILSQIAGATDADRVYFVQLDMERRTWRIAGQYCRPPAPQITHLTGTFSDLGEIAHSLEDGVPVVLNNLPPEQRCVFGTPNILLIPVLSHQPEKGIVGLERLQVNNPWRPDEQAKAEAEAAKLAIAAERLSLSGQLSERAEYFDVLYHLGMEATRADQSLDHLLQTIYEQCAALLPLEGFYIALSNTPKTEIYGAYFIDNGKRLFGISTPLKRNAPGFASYVYFSKEPLHIHDVRSDPLPAELIKIQGEETRSYIGVPLLVGGEVIGVLSVQSSRPNAYTEREVQLLSAIANLVAVSIANARMYDKLKEQARWARATNEIVSSVQPFSEPDEIIRTYANRIASQLAPDIVCYLEFRPENEKFQPLHVISKVQDGERLCAEEAKHQVEILSLKKTTPSPIRLELEAKQQSDGEWLLGVVKHQQLYGYLALRKKFGAGGSTWSKQEQQLINAIAIHIAMTLENNKLFHQEQHRRLLLESMQETTTQIIAEKDIGVAMKTIVQQAAEVFRADATALMLWDKSGENLVIKAHQGLSQKYVEQQKIPRTVLDQSGISKDHNIFIMEPLAEVAHGSREIVMQEGLVTDLVAVLFFRGKIIGALNIYSRHQPRHFIPEEFKDISIFANQSAMAIQNALLYTELSRYSRQLEEEVERRTIELRQEKERLEAIIRYASDGIIFADPDCRVLYVNPAWEKLTGYTLSETKSKDLRFLRVEKAPIITAANRAQLEQGKTIFGEPQIRRKDGRLVETALAITPILDHNGALTYLVAVQHDITQAKELLAMKEQFVSNVSHELRTPITNIKLFLSLLRKGRPEKQVHYLDTLELEADRLAQVIEDLLQLSRLTDKSMTLVKEPVQLQGLIQEVVDTFRLLAEQRGIRLHIQWDANLITIMANRQRLQQVLVNLLGNAIHYIDPGNDVWLTAINQLQGGQPGIVLQVRDNGPGIPVEEQPHIFDRFFRGKQARSNKVPGTGLGLAIVEEIVNQHGGQITLQSKSGEGTTFSIWLPEGDDSEGSSE